MFGLFKKKENLLDQQLSKKKPTILNKDIESNTQSVPLEQKNQDLKKSIEAKEKELATSQSATKTAKEEAQTAQKSLAETKAKLEAKEKELATTQTSTKTAKEEAQAAQKSLAETKAKLEAKEKELELLKVDTARLEDLDIYSQNVDQENELLLDQLLSFEKELVLQRERIVELEGFSQNYRQLIEKLEKRLPKYDDYDFIEVIKSDGVMNNPIVEFRIRDLLSDGKQTDDIHFAINLKDGHPGIGLLKNGKGEIFSPQLLSRDKKQADIFIKLSTTDFKRIEKIAGIIENLDKRQWMDIKGAKDFDFGFWRPFLLAVAIEFKKLPNILRYDEVRLKRELINTDYEHLWIELHGLSLGKLHWKKFEIRLGAALIQEGGFSQYPKFEFPLIDGKIKPFDSWYVESQDDHGGKLELRFSLEQKIFDIAVWSRLNHEDKVLMLYLIYTMPEILKRLKDDSVSIMRPWESWINFSRNAAEIMKEKQTQIKSEDKLEQNKALAEVDSSTASANLLNSKAFQGFKDKKLKVVNVEVKSKSFRGTKA